MPATIYDVRYPSQLQHVLSRIPEGKRTVLFFIADTDVESGWSWCSDTFLAFPVVMEQVKALHHSLTLIRVHCGNRSEWKNPNNPFHYEPFDISAVPTLVAWQRGKQGKQRLVEAEAYDKAKVRSFLKAAAKATAAAVAVGGEQAEGEEAR